MGYTNRQFQSATTNTPPAATDPMVDATTGGDVQAIKLLDPTEGSTAPLIGQKARSGSMPVALSTEDIAALTPPAAITGFATSANQATELASLASILAKLSADPASQTTLAAILAKIIAAPATEAKQDALRALIGEVQANPTALTVLDRLKSIQTALAGTLAISAASLPLPTGASTAANQSTTNAKLDTLLTQTDGVEASLTSIDSKLVSGPATAAKQDVGNTSLSTLVSQTDGIEGSLSSLDTKTPALGQALAAASTPVVLTAAQLATLTPPAAITGFATAANQATELASLASIDAGTPAALGQTTKSASMPVVPPSDFQQAILPTNSALSGSASALNGDIIASVDVSNYKSLSLQLTGTFGINAQVQFSNDGGTTWVAARGWSVSAGTTISTLSSTGIYVFPVEGALCRVRVTVYVSGTVVGNALFSSLPIVPYDLTVFPVGLQTPTDALTNPSANLNVTAFPLLFNGSATWDKQRGNNAAPGLASAARTASANADVVTYNARTLKVILNITAAPNTASTLTMAIRVKDSISGNYITILTAAAITGSVITATVPNTTQLSAGPGLVATANVSAAEALARTMNVLVTHSNADSWTYSVSVELGV